MSCVSYRVGHALCQQSGTQCANNLLTGCVKFSVRRYDSIPYGIIQASKNIHATEVAVILAVGMAYVSFEYLSVVITPCWLSFVLSGSKPKMSIAHIPTIPLQEWDVMALSNECYACFGTTMVAVHGFVHIASHIRPAKVSLHGIIYTTLSRVTEKRGIM